MLTKNLSELLKKEQAVSVLGISEQSCAFFAGSIQNSLENITVLVAKNAEHMDSVLEELSWFYPKKEVYPFPAWDVQPYDRLSADGSIQAARLRALTAVKNAIPCLIVTTANALSIKVPPLQNLPKTLQLKVNETVNRDEIIEILNNCGYMRVGTVMEAGEFSVRGSLLDIYIATESEPVRIDFFDDEIESIKTFDPVTQRTDKERKCVNIQSVTEVILNEESITKFRQGWRNHFPNGTLDGIYKDITDGRINDMMGHYLPLFYSENELPSFIDLLPEKALIIRSPLAEQAFESRSNAINEAYDARLNSISSDKGLDGEISDPYRPLKREYLYLQNEAWKKSHFQHKWLLMADFDDGSKTLKKLDVSSLTFSLVDKHEHKNVLDSAIALIKEARKLGHKVLLSAFSPSTLVRMERALEEHGLPTPKTVKNYNEFIRNDSLTMAVSPLSWGFYDKEIGQLIITEQDLFGEKNNRPTTRKKRKSEDVISHFNEIETDGLVVHVDHGIGRFEGLVTLEINETKEDFLHLVYEGGDKLYVPVVSLDVLSKYGGDIDNTKLDKLGGASWQVRKAKVKKDLMAMADDLIKVAAERETRIGHRYSQPGGMYDEFCAGFQFVPTLEQQQAVHDVEDDLYSDRVMDRLVVGDVGFGKTEVALRSAFIAASDGKQVAITVPTTLLARQHYENFSKRFKNFPLRVALLSRLVTGKQKTAVLEGLEKGEVDIVIGTHALLGSAVKFRDFGLLIVDEEQRFGVAHKEKLKQLKTNVDVLTLTATPIPRTLQMSLSGLRTLSMITTPPVDRLAIRSYVMKFDRKVMREAILREIFRGGQVFIVTPRVDGLEKLAEAIQKLVPESKVRIAHGQMPKDALDRTMTDFYEGKFNVIVATTIIESGIDVPRANTLIVHRADRFGLAQLYQIRGRVGRSKVRAYAYFLLPGIGHMTQDAIKRLQILQKLEGIGAGFTLASYDMDSRGSGNILGKEQSGHVKEVGFELYNKLLHEAVRITKHQKEKGASAELGGISSFSPTLNLGVSFLIPDLYVADLATRMSLYRRLSGLNSSDEIDDFSDELMDRFGDLPEEVSSLLHVVTMKNRCKALNILKLQVGPKGVVITLHNKTFPNPVALLHYVQRNAGLISVKPDQKIIMHRVMPEGQKRLLTIDTILKTLEGLL